MALIVEDGTGKADAQSYASEATLVAFAAGRGIVLKADTADKQSVLLTRAMDYLETLEGRFSGSRTTTTQALAWPRKDATLRGVEIAETTLPAPLVKALCQLACYADLTELMPSGDGREVIRKKIGPLETQYSESGGGANPQPALTAFWSFLDPLINNGSGFMLEIEHA